MKIIFDKEVNAADIKLVPIPSGGVDFTYLCDLINSIGIDILNLDFNYQGELIAIEVLDASRILPPELLRQKETKISIRETVAYNKSKDEAYIRFAPDPPVGIAFTYLCDPKEVKGTIKLDFDEKKRLIGIRVAEASKKLPEDVIKELDES